ncbi:unnamed protein product [Symbiodinium microadriaticum]|nr:unnamed protein product [Symbiodinium microadriaticum]CAE7884563.1 unnamed protein product [Symbiodinium sp. KB8]
MVPFSEQQLMVYVGDALAPHVHDDLSLRDGDVLVFARESLSRRHLDVRAHPFVDPSRWRPPSSLESPAGGEGLLVHYNQERFFMPPHHYSGQDPVSAARSAYDLHASECVTSAFRTDDLEFRGNACSHVLGVFPLPADHLEAPFNARRRDYVALCDFRPVGYSPRLVLVHVPIVHLPSLAALFGIRVPSGLRLRSLNGTQTGDEVEFSGHQVLTFVFEECPDAEEPVSAFALLDDLLDSSPPYHNVPVHFRAEGRWCRPFAVTPLNDPNQAVKETDQIAMWGPWYKYDVLPEGTLEPTPTVCPVLEATSPILCLEDLHPQKGPDALWAPLTCKLLSEPESHSLAERDRIEDARDFEEGEGRVWPFLPAGDQYAMQRLAERAEIEEDTFQSEEASDFTFCLLTPGYVLEPVVVTLTAPIEVPEALDAVQTERDQVRRRLYPSLVVVGPQPAQGFGVLLALPVWTSPEVFICFSLLDIDDRLFTAPVPAVVSRERLLEIAALMPAEHFDVYVGGSPTPMLDEQEADMMRGMCVFFFPRHVLPGPYFNLTESLLSSTVWESEPSIPFGPSDGYMCFVGEFALRRLPLAEDTSFPDAALVADAMGLNPSTMSVQPAFPATRDVAIDGFYCYNVCAALDPADHIEPSEHPTCVVLVDCRALLQGWQMVSSPEGIFSRRQLLEDLEIFAPPGWSVHLEGVPSPLTAEADEPQHSHAAESDDSESDMSLQSEASDPGSARRDRSRSPYRNPADAAGTPATAPVKVPFLLLGQEYAPELVVVLRTDDLEECIRSVQRGRDGSNRSRFGHVVPVRPQPAAEYALAVVKPTWSTHVFVIFDCLKVNGVAFCWLVSPAMTRSAILTVSGLPDTADYEVYAPDRDMPLGQFEVCNLETGACISIIPAACQFFVVTSLEDMLLSNDGWSTEAALPCAPGEWLYVLSDSGPCSLQLAEARADLLTPAVATILELPLQSATLQLAVPPVDDFADEGRLAWNVVAATSDSSYRQGCIYFLDLRPILCGLTWAHSPDGTVSTELIRSQCARPAAGGHQVQVLGGRPLANAAGIVSVWPGEVLVVTVADSPEPPVASGSSCETDSESHDPARPGPNGSSDPGDSAMPDDGRQPNDSEARDTSTLSGAPSERRFAPPHQLLGRRPVDCLSYSCASRAARQRPLVHFATAIVAFAVIALLASAIRHEASLALCLLPLGYPRRLLSVLAALWITRLPAVASVQIKGPGFLPFETEARPLSALPQIRAVATPCRGPEFPRFAFPDVWESSERSAMGVDFEDLSTLLDESVRAPECTAFFEATMLVETLFEHFCPHLLPEVASDKPVCPLSLALQTGNLTRSHDISAGEPPCQLVLAALLLPDEAAAPRSGATQATDWYALDRGCCSLPVSDVHWRDLTRFTPLIKLMRDIQDLPDRHRFSRWCGAGGHLTLPADTSALCLTSDGSFSSSQGTAGWGLVISATTPDHPDVPGLFIGFTAAASIDTWRFGGDGAPALNAFCSEIVGLFWAAVAAFQIPFDGQVIFRCDNEAALGIASGSHVAPCQAVTAACQSLHQAFALRFPGRAVYAHVRGHSGDPANELADASANHGAVTPMPQVFQLDLPAWFRPGGSAFPWLPHLGWTFARPLQGPSCTSGSLRWDLTEPIASLNAEQLMRPFTRAFPAHKEPKTGARKLCLGFATFNTLPLACPGEDRGVQSGMYGHTGRVALLDASLFAEEIFVAGLQETRTPAGQLYSKHYHRYCSGCLEKRAFGIEIWVCIAKGWPSHKAVVLHASPTRLILRLSTCGKHLGVLAAHGLHRGHSSAARLAWWKETSDLCLAVCSGLEWVFLLDGNCSLGSTVSHCIGSFGAEEEDTAGEAMHHLLHACNTWVPSTFPDAFTGDSGTLVQKRSGTLSRRDYVALPSAWRDCVKYGYVSPGINAGHSVPDHFAVVIQVELNLCTGHVPKSSARIDGEALLLPHNREAVEGIISALPQVPWTVNVNDHVAHLVDSLYEGLVSRFPRQRRRMRNSFLSEETSLVHASLAAHRHALRWRMAEMRRCYKRCAFLAWRSHDAFDDLFCGAWIRQLRGSIGQITLAVGHLGRQIRRLCRRDRAAFLNRLATDVDEADVSSVHKALRHLLRPKKFRRSGPDPLPRLRRPDGSYCQTPDEITAEWRRHFSELEGGVESDIPAFVQAGLTRQQAVEGFSVLSSEDLPSFSTVVSAFQRVKAHKAAGPDFLPSSICKRFAFRLSEHFWPVILKTFLHLSEPLPLKGGVLHHIPKPSPSVRDVAAAQRGILVQSIFSKVLHRVCRPFPAKLMEARAPSLQVGGRAGRTYMFGSFVSRCFLGFARTNSVSAAVVFTDLVAAYYSVVREAVTGLDSAASIRDVAASLKLTEADLQELEMHAREDPVLAGMDSSDFLRAVTLELHSDTWFHLSGDSRIVRTARGTRPGGCLADTIFCLLFQRVLDRRVPADMSNIPCIPWTGQRDLCLFDARSSPAAPSVTVEDVTYADDHASFVVAPSASLLETAVRNTAGRTLDSIAGHGLAANIGPRKTAALMVHRGAGAKQARERVFGTLKGRLHVLREHDFPIQLDAAPFFQKLRRKRLTDDSALLEVVRPHVEPFPTLRNTLQFWESELEHSAQLDAVSDLLLCFSPFWLCEDAADRGNDPQEDSFSPDVRFIPWAPRPAGLPGLILDFPESQASRVAGAFPGGGWRTFSFARPPHLSLDFACAVICLPAPPCSCVSLWRTDSCPLRMQRLHHTWLCQCLEWLRLVFRLMLKGRRCVRDGHFTIQKEKDTPQNPVLSLKAGVLMKDLASAASGASPDLGRQTLQSQRKQMEDRDYFILKIRLLSGIEYDFRVHELTPWSVQLETICRQLGLQGNPVLLHEDDDIFDITGLRLRDICDKEERFTLVMETPPQVSKADARQDKWKSRSPNAEIMAQVCFRDEYLLVEDPDDDVCRICAEHRGLNCVELNNDTEDTWSDLQEDTASEIENEVEDAPSVADLDVAKVDVVPLSGSVKRSYE